MRKSVQLFRLDNKVLNCLLSLWTYFRELDPLALLFHPPDHTDRIDGIAGLGTRTADIIATLWPERCKVLVSVSGYLIGSQTAGKVALPPKADERILSDSFSEDWPDLAINDLGNVRRNASRTRKPGYL